MQLQAHEYLSYGKIPQNGAKKENGRTEVKEARTQS